jgi:hypothetical protein
MNSKAAQPSAIAHATVTTPAKASQAQGQCAEIRRIWVAGGTSDVCCGSNEPEITSNAGMLRNGSSRGEGKGKGSVVDKIRSELGILK